MINYTRRANQTIGLTHFKTKCIVQINTEIGSFLEDYVLLIRSLLRLIHELISGLFTHLCEHSSILLYTHRCY